MGRERLELSWISPAGFGNLGVVPALIPPKETLEELYQEFSDDELAFRYGVSAATVRRWRRRYKITSKNRGPRVGTSLSRVSDTQVQVAVQQSNSIAGVLRLLGLVETGSAHSGMKERVGRLGCDTSHFGKTPKVRVLGLAAYRRPLSELLQQNTRPQNRTKARLLREGVFQEVCAICGLAPEWNGKPLTLQLDHVDGDRYNNDITNLRIVCPNCHTQTPTFCSRNRK